jgi:hypothetical protein
MPFSCPQNEQTGGVPPQFVGYSNIFSEKRPGPRPQQHFCGLLHFSNLFASFRFFLLQNSSPST